MGLFDALKEKLGLQPRIVYLQAPKVPARVPIQAVPVSNDSLAATESAALVSGSSHKKGVSNDNRSSLIDGR